MRPWPTNDPTHPESTELATRGLVLVSEVVNKPLVRLRRSLWSYSPLVSQWVGWRHSGGGSQAQADLALLGQPVDDLRLEVSVVDARLPEGPSVAVLLPVVVPVALLVGAVAKHRHLDTDTSYGHTCKMSNLDKVEGQC